MGRLADPFGRTIPGDWAYDAWPSGEPYDWAPAVRGDNPYDNLDFHLDIGCGRMKKGRIGIDRWEEPGVDLVFDLNQMMYPPRPTSFSPGPRPGVLPIPADSIESIITHHCLEHIGSGLLGLMDECYRILVPGGIMRIIVPLFPSFSAVSDPEHCRYFTDRAFDAFCGPQVGPFWSDGFAAPYTSARFEKLEETADPLPENWQELFGPDCARELRVALRK